MHLQLSKEGIFKHSGDRIAYDQLSYLIYLAIKGKEVIEGIRKAIEKGFTLECEVFGKDYTPRGFIKTILK